MGSNQISVFCRKIHQNLSLSLMFLLISTWAPLIFTAEGRPIFRPVDGHSQEEKAMLREQIGSRPPRCKRRYSSCGHCEAIQVPTNPHIKNIGSRLNSSASNTMSTVDYGSSNYMVFRLERKSCKDLDMEEEDEVQEGTWGTGTVGGWVLGLCSEDGRTW